jgi:hypothetical protein
MSESRNFSQKPQVSGWAEMPLTSSVELQQARSPMTARVIGLLIGITIAGR